MINDIHAALANPKGAIFDMDGTLLDSMPLWENLAQRYLEQKGVTHITEDLSNHFKDMSFKEVALYFQTHYGIKESEAEITLGIQALIEEEYRDRIPLKPGARIFLEKLHQKGTSLCIATANFPHLTKLAIKRLGIDHYFKDIITCMDLGLDKNRPEFFLRILDILKTPLHETLVFEDALYAISSAKKAGFPVVAVFDESAARDISAIQSIADKYLISFDDWEWNDR